MNDKKDEEILDKIYPIMEEWVDDLKPIKRPKEYLDSIWELIKTR